MFWRIICLTCLSLAAVQAVGAGLVASDSHSRLLSLVWFVLSCFAVRSWASRPRVILSLIVLGLAVLGTNMIVGEEGSILFVAFLICALALARGDDSPLRNSDLIALSAWLALILASRGVTSLWLLLQDLAAGYAGLANALWSGAPDRFGATASGIHVAILGLLFLASGNSNRTKSGVLRKSAAAALILLAPVGILMMTGWWMEGRIFDHFDMQAVFPFVVPSLFVPVIVASAVFGGRETTERVAPPERAARRSRLAVMSVLLIPLLIATLSAPFGLAEAVQADEGTRVLFLEENAALHDFTQPDWKQVAGFGRTGIYGSLVSLLERVGFEAARTGGPLDKSKMKGADVLVIINPTRKMGQSELDLIANHVDEGGGLLVLTDHTDLMGLMAGTNQLVERYGMELRFDTVMETKRAFVGNLDVHGSRIFPGEIPPVNLQILHGASLRLSGDADPLVVGRTMSGDFGDRSNAGPGAFLGDYRISPADEQLGDIVLAASALSGDGRVITFGDTSSFQNLALSRSSAAMIDVFDWLSGRGRSRGPVHGLGLYLFLASLAFLFLPSLRPEVAVLAPLALGLVILTLGARDCEVGNARIADRLPESGSFFLHDAHLSQFDRDNFQSNSIQGLLAIGEREGLKPVVGDLRELDDLSRVKVITLVAPTETLELPLIERLERWVEDGGRLLVCSGYEERNGAAELLARQGLEIAGIPLSAAPVRRSDQAPILQSPKAVEAWPVKFDKSSEARVVWESDGFPIVVEKTRGKGAIVAFGDSYFLNDRNLEGEDRVNKENLNLLLVSLGHANGLEDVVK